MVDHWVGAIGLGAICRDATFENKDVNPNLHNIPIGMSAVNQVVGLILSRLLQSLDDFR